MANAYQLISIEQVDGLAAALEAASNTPAEILASLLTVDGPGSGLNADLLDGYNSTDFVFTSSYTAADVLAKLITVDGSGSGLDADLFDGYNSDAFPRKAETATISGSWSFSTGYIHGIGTTARLDLDDNFGASLVYGTSRLAIGGPLIFYISSIEKLRINTNDVAFHSGTITANGNSIWHAGNDGAASGLDADLLDGQHGSYYFPVSGGSFTGNISIVKASPSITINDTTYVNPSALGLFRIYSAAGNLYFTRNTSTARDYATESSILNMNSSTGVVAFTSGPFVGANQIWHAGNDGTGSTLDADLLDGQEGSYYRDAGNLNAGTILAARMPAHTGDVTSSAASVALTLATVNGNVGSFGSATATSTFTVNAKGLITAAGSTTITPAWGSITSVPAGVTSLAALTGAGVVTATSTGVLAMRSIGVAGSTEIPDRAAADSRYLTLSGGTLAGYLVLHADPASAMQAATKQYVDTVASGLSPKAAVRAATTVAGGNITLSGTQTIDGVAVIAGNRVLVKDQTSSLQNGIYVCAAGAWSRATDADSWAELVSAFVFVEEGTNNADTGWTCTVNSGGTLGTTAVTWVQFSGSATFTASTGITKVGSDFQLTGQALALHNLATNGSIHRTGSGTYASRTLTAPAAGITVTNGDGVAGNPTLVLANDLAAVEGLATTGIVRRTSTDTWSASALVNADLPASGVTASTYRSVTVNAQGIITGGTNPTTISGYGITDAVARASFAVSPNSSMAAIDSRAITNPTTGLGYSGGGRFRFSALNDDNTTPYADVIDLSTYTDSSGGGFNALYFSKSSHLLKHKFAVAGATSWDTKTVAYTDSNITGNTTGSAGSLANGRTISITGDLTWTSPSFNGTSNITAAGTLATVNGNVGSFGSATAATIFTVNAKGLITAASSATITPAWSSITSKPTTLSGYSVTAADVLSTLLTVDGASSALDADLLDGRHGSQFVMLGGTGTNADATMDSAFWTDNGQVGIAYISGGTNFPNSQTAGGAYTFKNFVGASNSAYSRAFQFFKGSGDTSLYMRGFDSGGVGNAWGKIWTDVNDGAGSTLDADLLDGQQGSYYQDAGNLNAGTILAARMPALTGDITTSAGAVATTLATVNGNVGSFGSATAATIFTVNAKGLITAASSATITPAWSSITSKPTTISGYGITDAVLKTGDTMSGKLGINSSALGGNALDVYTASAGSIAVFQSNAPAAGNTLIALNQGGSTVTGSLYGLKASLSCTSEAMLTMQQNGAGAAILEALVLGAGDAASRYLINGGQAWTVGLDNSDSDKFKISGSGTLGTTDRLTIDTSGLVGIGTTTPSSLLHLRAASAPTVRLENDTATSTSAYQFYSGSTLEGAISHYAQTAALTISSGRSVAWGGHIILATDTVEKMRITSTGLVGIGTSAPFSRLHLSTSSAVDGMTLGSPTGVGLTVSNADPAYGLNMGTHGSGRSWIQASRVDGTATAYDLSLQASGGSVGIGIAAPSHKLHVRGEGDVRVYVEDDNTNGRGGYLRSVTGGAVTLGTSSGVRDLVFAPDNTERMRILTTGNVGIGTASPATALDVAGTITSTGGNFETTNGGDRSITLRSSTSYNWQLRSTGDHFQIREASDAAKIRLAITYPNGYVGIGTASPGSVLELFNAATFNARTSGLNVHRPSSYGQYGSMAYDGDTTYFSSTYTGGGAGVYGAFRFWAYDSTSTPVDRFRIASNGDVCFGSTAPTQKFGVDVSREQVFGVDTLGYVTMPHADASGFSALKAASGRGLRLMSGSSTLVSMPSSLASTLVLGYAALQIGDSSGSGTPIRLFSIGASDLVLRGGDGDVSRTADVIVTVKNNVEVARFADTGVVSFANTSVTAAGNAMWHAGNDGAASGLDADLLDGVQGASYALLASPALTGTPTAPTAAAATNTTQIATTAFVTTADNLKANLASPTFTGTPAAPTAAALTNTTQIATTAFVTTADNLKANIAAPSFTGNGVITSSSGGTATITFTISDTHTATQSLTVPWAAYDFTSADLSGVGAGVRCRIGAVSEAASGANTKISFFTAPTTAGTMVEQMTIGSQGPITFTSSTVTAAGNAVWHAGNDGAASTLDADLLDGQHGSYYQNAGNLNAGTILAARMPALTGDITTSAGAVATTLATVNGNVGSFGSATAAATFTVNAKGLITAAGSTTVTPAWSSITSKPTTLSGYAITDAMPLSGGNFTGNIGIVKASPSITINDTTYVDPSPLGLFRIYSASANLYITRNTSTNRSYGTESSTVAISSSTGVWNFTSAPLVSSSTMWHAGNDGAGSTLDADLLDGQQGAWYAPIGSPTFTGTVTMPAFSVTSDQRLKTSIEPLQGYGEFLDATKIYSFIKDGKHQFGVLAHEAQEVRPELVSTVPHDEFGEVMAVNPMDYLFALVAEVQDLRKRVAQLEGK